MRCGPSRDFSMLFSFRPESRLDLVRHGLMYLSSVVGGVLEGSLAAVVQPLRPPLEMFAVVAPALAFSNTTNEPCCLEDA